MVQQTDSKKTYPWVSAKAWWDLRRRFVQSPPGKVDAGYIQTVLNTDTADAARSTLRGLKAVGLVDDSNNRTARALDWREDDRYPAVCQQMREEVYPRSLLDALPAPSPDREAVERWFSRETGTGKAAVSKMAAFYILLCEADPAAGRPVDKPARPAAPKPRQRETTRTQQARPTQPSANGHANPAPVAIPAAQQQANGPTLHMDVHIHVDGGLSLDQIDQVFASMSKHLYGGQIVK